MLRMLMMLFCKVGIHDFRPRVLDAEQVVVAYCCERCGQGEVSDERRGALVGGEGVPPLSRRPFCRGL